MTSKENNYRKRSKKKGAEKKVNKTDFAAKRDLAKLITDFENQQKNIEIHKRKGIYEKLNENEKCLKIKAKIIENENGNYILLYRGTVKLYLPYNLSNLNNNIENIGTKLTVIVKSVDKAKTEDGLPLVSCLS